MLTVNLTATVDVATYHNDNSRTGQNLSETILTPSNVNSAIFRPVEFPPARWAGRRPAAVPLERRHPGLGTHNVLYAATENDSVYAFDATTGGVLWQTSVLGPGETVSDDRGCSEITPEIGITATPVIDRTRGPHGAIYVVAMSTDGRGQSLPAPARADIATGAEMFGGPTTIAATFPGTGDGTNGASVVFDPAQYKERAALLLSNGDGLHGLGFALQRAAYTGWVMAFDANHSRHDERAEHDAERQRRRGLHGRRGIGGGFRGECLPAEWPRHVSTRRSTPAGFPSRAILATLLEAFDFRRACGRGLFRAVEYHSRVGAERGPRLRRRAAVARFDRRPRPSPASGCWRGPGHESLRRQAAIRWANSTRPAIRSTRNLTARSRGGEFTAPAVLQQHSLFWAERQVRRQAFAISNAQLAATPASQTGGTFASPGTAPAVSANGAGSAICGRCIRSCGRRSARLRCDEPRQRTVQLGAGRFGARQLRRREPVRHSDDRQRQCFRGHDGPASRCSVFCPAGPPMLRRRLSPQPVDQLVNPGQTVDVHRRGDRVGAHQLPVAENGANIPGATSSSYTTGPATADDDRTIYSVVVANIFGSVASRGALVAVNAAPQITTQPANQSVTTGQTATFSVSVLSPYPISYKWQMNGTDIPGATPLAIPTPPAALADSGEQFTAVVSNGLGNAASSAATLLVAPPAATETYYVDFYGGSDGNNGTSSVAPWQHAPGMNGCAANCAVAVLHPGDPRDLQGRRNLGQAAVPYDGELVGEHRESDLLWRGSDVVLRRCVDAAGVQSRRHCLDVRAGAGQVR